MAYNEKLAALTRELISLSNPNTEEKAMFGGLCFMVNDKMCVGVEKDRLMVRLDPEIYEEVLTKEGCKPMDFTGRVMKGYVFVDAAVLNTKKNLNTGLTGLLRIIKSPNLPKKRDKIRPSFGSPVMVGGVFLFLCRTLIFLY